ncbi:MAG: hypothetical protein ACPGOV_02970 [Magnetovibrionaceae bacterium]
MTQATTLSNLIGNSLTRPGTPTRPQASQETYAGSEQVRSLASVTRNDPTPENAVRLRRLDNILESGRPLREDVPRGFYVDISI